MHLSHKLTHHDIGQASVPPREVVSSSGTLSSQYTVARRHTLLETELDHSHFLWILHHIQPTCHHQDISEGLRNLPGRIH